jgi:hypothetical protein
VPKNHLKLSILMFMWASYYLSSIFFHAINVGLGSAIAEIESSQIVAKGIANLILLAISYVIFGITALYYQTSSASLIVLKYGPLIAAILLTIDFLQTNFSNINWQVFGFGLIMQSALFVFMPWVLAILAFGISKKESQNAT